MSGNITKLYKYDSKCDDQTQYKSILESEMISTPEVSTDNIPMLPGPSVTVKSLVQENHFVNFLKYWMSNKRLLSAG